MKYDTYKEMKTTQLKNGITVATQERPGLVSTVAVSFRVGSTMEQEHESGMAHFLEHMLFKGTATMTSEEITKGIEIRGSNFNAFTSKTATSYYVEGLAENTEYALSILAEMVTTPQLLQEEIDKERNVIHQEISMYDDDAINVAIRTMEANSYDAIVGREIIGTHETIDTFTRDGLMSFYRRLYTGKNMFVTMVGPMPHDEFVSHVERYLNAIEPGIENEYPVGVRNHYEDRIEDSGFEQTIGLLTFDSHYFKTVEEKTILTVLKGVLADGMSSPLMLNVRERAALCYFVGAQVDMGMTHSKFYIYGGTSSDKVDQMLDMSLVELNKIASGEVNDDDYNRTINMVSYAMSEADSKIGAIHNRLRTAVLEDVPYRTSEEIVNAVRNVSKEDIINAAKRLTANKPNRFILG